MAKSPDGCTGKVRHYNRLGAEIHIRRTYSKRALRLNVYEPYFCEKCRGFHVGHSRRKNHETDLEEDAPIVEPPRREVFPANFIAGRFTLGDFAKS